MLKPHDLVVALRYALHHDDAPISMVGVGSLLGLSGSEIHAAIRRARQAGLMAKYLANRDALVEFVLHGVRYAYFVERGPVTRGFPTAHAAPPLDKFIRPNGLPPVWPDPEGPVRGESFAPLYKSASVAARSDRRMYKALALIDAIRGGRARERSKASELFPKLVLE
jgi:hypothetical protein